jgi:hypothetical protein
VGFLRLFQLDTSDGRNSETVPGDRIPGDQIVIAMGGDASASDRAPLEQIEIAGITVQVTEQPSRPMSRYWYSWVVDDVSGVIDGATREPVERWLTLYLELVTANAE